MKLFRQIYSLIFGSRWLQFCPARGRNVLFAGGILMLAQTSVFATPVEEINRAVAANNVTDVSLATQKQFVKAFTAVALRVQSRDLPDYVIAAINLRPELAPKVVAAAIKIAVKQHGAKPGTMCLLVEQIIKAAIAANPDEAVSIAKAGSAAAPEFRRCVLTAAVAAAPSEKEAIVHAATTKAVPLAFLTFSGADSSGFSFSAATLNPANISQVGDDDAVTSPEQPPVP